MNLCLFMYVCMYVCMYVYVRMYVFSRRLEGGYFPRGVDCFLSSYIGARGNSFPFRRDILQASLLQPWNPIEERSLPLYAYMQLYVQ